MKVVLWLQDSRSLHGAERATLQLAGGLDAAGVAVRVLLMRETRMGEGPRPLAEALRAVVPVEEIPVRGRVSRPAVMRLREYMAAERADILHSTGYKADWHAGMASRGGSLFPVVSTVHGWLFRRDFKERFFQALNIRTLRRFSRVIVLSRFYEAYLRRRGFTPLQLARIPTGMESERIVRREEALRLWETAESVFTFGFLGRLSEEKDPGLLLRASARLARDLRNSPRPWRLLVAGEGPMRRHLERRIRWMGLSECVTLAGRMEPDDFFRQVHVLAQCSRVENQPMSVMEAMAWMRPVLATRAGGLPELVRSGETGWVIPRRSARKLAGAMKECLMAPDRAREAGRRGREWLARDFSFKTMVEDHIGMYAACLPPKRG
ncbi:MAG: glycosyltransferase [Lentisphaerae bacterium]|nr:glycosyltransferase [Lentisphaerota bacterium]